MLWHFSCYNRRWKVGNAYSQFLKQKKAIKDIGIAKCGKKKHIFPPRDRKFYFCLCVEEGDAAVT